MEATVKDFAEGAWRLTARSEPSRRPEMQDAWAAVTSVRLGRRTSNVIGVFDGVGGVAHARSAAHAAAENLSQAVAQSRAPDEILHRLNPHVQATGGATTAVLALFNGSDRVVLAGVGDSAAFALDRRGRAESLLPLDAHDHRTVTDCLGSPGLRGHTRKVRVRPGAAVLLCSDGVHTATSAQQLQAALNANDDERALDGLLDAWRADGRRDDATLLLLRRLA